MWGFLRTLFHKLKMLDVTTTEGRSGVFARVRHAVGIIVAGRGSAAAAVQTLFTKLLVLALNALTSIVVARILKPEGRGEMAALAMWSGFLGGMLTLGIPSSLVYNIRRTPERASQLIGAALIIGLGLGALTGLAGFAGLPFWLNHYSPEFIVYARWFLLSSPIPIFLLLARAALEADGKFAQSNASWWLAPAVTLLGLIVLALWHRLMPITGSLAYVLGNVPVLFWLMLEVFRRYRPQFRGPFSLYKGLIQYGARAWGIDLLTALTLQADQVLVVRFLSPSAMGVYVVAASLARLLGALQSSVVTVLFPRAAARSSDEVLSLTGRAVRITTAFAVVGALAVGLIGPLLMRSIYGREYADQGTAVFRILLLDVVLSGATQILAQAYMALGRPGLMTVVQAAGLSAGLLVMAVLIPRFGVLGAGIALALSSSVRFVTTLSCFRPLLKTSAPAIFPRREDFFFLRRRLGMFVGIPSEVI